MLMHMGVLVIENQFSLALLIEGGILQLLDPFSLQAYCALKLPYNYSIYDFAVHSNTLYGYGRRQMYMAELDYEAKGCRSMFCEIPAVYERHRESIVVRRKINQGLFSRERNIS